MRITNNILRREVDSKHFLFKYKAYCFDTSIMNHFKNKAWNELEIITATGRVYFIGKEDFFKKSFISNEFGKRQYILRVKEMETRTKTDSKSIVIPKEIHSIIKQRAKEEEVTIADLMNKLFRAS